MPIPAEPLSLPPLPWCPRRTDALRAAGVSRRALSTGLWPPMTRGVRIPDGSPLADPMDRILAAVELMPDGAALGGWAALYLHGATDLDGREGTRQLPVPICLNPSGRIRKRDFLRIDRRRLPDADITEVNGITVTTPVRSASDIACDRGVEKGVVAADTAARFGLLTAAQLRAYVRRRPRTTGLIAARQAADLASDGAKSVPESVFRYLWVVEAGLPRPLVNVPVFALPDGVIIAEADLLDVQAGMVGEFDGAQHRELEQHTRDNIREEGLESLNLVVARATSIDLWPQRRALAHRLRIRHAQGMARDRSRDRWGYLSEPPNPTPRPPSMRR